MQQNRSRTPWLLCGVIAFIGVCLVGSVIGGVLIYNATKDMPTATPEMQAVTIPTRVALPTQGAQPTAVKGVSAGDIAGIPYKAVVQIIAMVQTESGLEAGWSGSGSIISADGLILTNGHVVLSDRYYTVDHLVVALTTQPDEQPTPTYIAKIMQADQALDIAVIRIETDLNGNPVDRAALNLPTVPLGSDAALNLGDALVIIGYPGIGGSTITLTRGEVAGFTAETGYGNRAFIKTSATISGGNSGGLAANDKGELIGVPTQLGYGGGDQYVDCRVLADTNRDGVVDDKDNCVPTGGFINALRPLSLAMPFIEAAKRGEINIKEGVQGQQGALPTENTAKVLYQDDFSDLNSGWTTDNWDAGAVGYVDGVYQVTVKPQNYLVWSYPGDSASDTVISVQTAVLAKTGGGDYGVICRLQDDDNFYALEISEDGYFTIWKKVNGETVSLYDWEFSDAIPMDEVITINAGCVGNQFLLGVNDTLLASVTDDSFREGKFGLLAGTYEQGDITVGFDNYSVYQP